MTINGCHGDGGENELRPFDRMKSGGSAWKAANSESHAREGEGERMQAMALVMGGLAWEPHDLPWRKVDYVVRCWSSKGWRVGVREWPAIELPACKLRFLLSMEC